MRRTRWLGGIGTILSKRLLEGASQPSQLRRRLTVARLSALKKSGARITPSS